MIGPAFFGMIPGVELISRDVREKPGHTIVCPVFLVMLGRRYRTVTITGTVWLIAPDVPVTIRVA